MMLATEHERCWQELSDLSHTEDSHQLLGGGSNCALALKFLKLIFR